jgi:hypothetical protein
MERNICTMSRRKDLIESWILDNPRFQSQFDVAREVLLEYVIAHDHVDTAQLLEQLRANTKLRNAILERVERRARLAKDSQSPEE